MKAKSVTYIFILLVLLFFGCENWNQQNLSDSNYQPIPEDASPWVYWYWNNAAVSKEGITTDLKAMKQAGLGGAYLFFIRGESNPPMFEPAAVQLTPEWWKLVDFAFSEAKRMDLKLGLHSCDGFTVSGGPWITPEKSMQKVVWTDTIVSGGSNFSGKLKQPETIKNYYEDIKIFAYPTAEKSGISSYQLNPEITSSIAGNNPTYLNDPSTPERFRSSEQCWVQYAFEEPFTCRSLVVKMPGSNFQSSRIIVEVSNDGDNFRFHTQFQPHRQGWIDEEADITHSIEPVEAKYFRFVYNPEGTEPGAEDLDAAKWKQSLKIAGIELSSNPKIHQFEGKNGSIWRIANHTTSEQIPEMLCVKADEIKDITSFFNEGELTWEVPPGKWTILRMGHTSTGKTNYIAGGGLGLESDKFDPFTTELQFDSWLGEFYRKIGDVKVSEVLKYFHVDSWECGSQNWSPVFAEEFEKHRGYSLMPYLPIIAGIPVNSNTFSEKVLLDIRTTISELIKDNFYGTFKRLAHEKGLAFSAESVAPVMVSDGMLHQKNVDIPMGEFWLNSPTHDKPNDMLDAISAGHIYGKKIIQSESFTEIRIDWNEHPGMLKTLGDRNFALGINRFVFHVFNHNPWIDRKPGMTLGVVGLFFQPNQTWFQPGKAWIDYLKNCQHLLQQGNHVADVAVFTGEEIPRRAVLPDRLVTVFPDIFGEETVQKEKIRIENKGTPTQQKPLGVTCSKNITEPADWVDPLKGYAYDSFNKDALIRLTKVNKGRIELPGGASYALLVIPGKRRMNPEAKMSAEVAQKLVQLVKDGATVYFQEKSLPLFEDKGFESAINELFSAENSASISNTLKLKKLGKGAVVTGFYDAVSFSPLGIEKDFYALNEKEEQALKLAWTHRAAADKEIYFISNQEDRKRNLELSFRVLGKIPELYFPVSGVKRVCKNWSIENGRTIIPFQFENNESVFVLFEKETAETAVQTGKNRGELEILKMFDGNWEVKFDKEFGGPENPILFENLTDWSKNKNEKIEFYSGTAVYSKLFEWNMDSKKEVWIDVGEVNNLAEIRVNGNSCGVAWTAPFQINISEALVKGSNKLEIAVTNTWENRLIGDHNLPENEKNTWTTAPYRLENRPLLKSGLIGPVKLLREKN